MAEEKRAVLAVFETVSFPDFGMKNVKAKIDTGAYTGALHCTKIHESITNGVKELHFSPFDQPKTQVKTTDFKQRTVTSSNGQEEKRYFITTQIVIKGQMYPITLSLANRSAMKWSVLVGRKFLRANNFLVDVNASNR